MFRPASRVIARSSALRSLARPAPTRRFLSTSPPTQKSRSWKSAAVRWGIAGAVIYYYNTTDLFAEEPQQPVHSLPQTEQETETLPTIEAITKERQERKAALAAATEVAANAPKQEAAQETVPAGGVEELEEEAGQQGAFNPETGEINWDCPCLGGMAHGPCGEDFKAAFSCFVYSTEEPKGMDCIDKFKDMQNCFRQYPEIYGAELESDEDDDVTADDARLAATPEAPSKSVAESAPVTASNATEEKVKEKGSSPSQSEKKDGAQLAQAATEQVKKDHEPLSESEALVPKAVHDARDANQEK